MPPGQVWMLYVSDLHHDEAAASLPAHNLPAGDLTHLQTHLQQGHQYVAPLYPIEAMYYS